jgi:spore coat polysaccharide biosynthesis protein SpsF
MVVGQQDKKVIFIVQARMRSTRLPGKILLPIPFGCGKPILKWITDALKTSTYHQNIIIASSTDYSNDTLIEFCEKENIFLHRGAEDDVLSRFTAILSKNDFDVVVRLTGDNPIIDIQKLDLALENHFKSEADYTSTFGLPLGMNFEIINTNALLSLQNENLSNSDKEHVTLFIKNNSAFHKNVFRFSDIPSSIRATIDYPSDFLFVSSYFEYILHNSKISSFETLEEFVVKFPWILEGNNQNFQKKEFQTLKEEIEEAIPILDKIELKKVVAFLSNNYY